MESVEITFSDVTGHLTVLLLLPLLLLLLLLLFDMFIIYNSCVKLLKSAYAML